MKANASDTRAQNGPIIASTITIQSADERLYAKKMKKLEKKAEKLKIAEESNGFTEDPYAHLYKNDNSDQ